MFYHEKRGFASGISRVLLSVNFLAEEEIIQLHVQG